MGFGDFLFGGSEQLTPQLLGTPTQIAGREDLLVESLKAALERLQRAGEPYPGQLPGTAGPSEYEQMGLEQLGQYLQGPLPSEGSLWGQAKGEIGKTLGGEEYDPVQGAYYQAYRSQVMRELEEAKDRLGAQTSARDKYFGGGRIQTTGELEETATGNLAMTLGQLSERERVRRLGAVEPAMRMTAFEEAEPLARVQASQTFGALPRQLEEAGLGAQYGEWIRQLQDLGVPLETAMTLAMYKPEYYYPTYSHTPGLLGGPSGLSMQPTGGSGDAQKALSVLNSMMQMLGSANAASGVS